MKGTEKKNFFHDNKEGGNWILPFLRNFIYEYQQIQTKNKLNVYQINRMIHSNHESAFIHANSTSFIVCSQLNWAAIESFANWLIIYLSIYNLFNLTVILKKKKSDIEINWIWIYKCSLVFADDNVKCNWLKCQLSLLSFNNSSFF